jgi:hypothetical protein
MTELSLDERSVDVNQSGPVVPSTLANMLSRLRGWLLLDSASRDVGGDLAERWVFGGIEVTESQRLGGFDY